MSTWDILPNQDPTCQPRGVSNEFVDCKGRVRQKLFIGEKPKLANITGGFNLFTL
jgi:hypothetical protein